MHNASTAPALQPSWDPVWDEIRAELTVQAAAEPVLAPFLNANVLERASLEDALGFNLAHKLATHDVPAGNLKGVFDEAYLTDPSIVESARIDMRAVRERDPATRTLSEPLLYFKGFHALQSYRVAHWLWARQRQRLAMYLQNRISQVFGVDIHPAAEIGVGIMIDHATSVVIGETAVVEDNVSILHEVTLGGTGKDTGDRHPKVRKGVLIGAGAKLLGNVEIGTGAKVGAGSVVLEDVPAHCTVVGVPAVVAGCTDCDAPALEMDHRLPHTGEPPREA